MAAAKKTPVNVLADAPKKEEKAAVETAKKTVEVLEEKKTAEVVKETEKKVAEETGKKTAGKVSAKKAPEKTVEKAPEKTVEKTAEKTETKTNAKKTTKKTVKKEETVTLTIQYNNRDVTAKTIVEKVKEDYAKKAGADAAIETMDLYVQPLENVVYYVINGEGGPEFKVEL